jgi:hypothetical protein
MVFGDKPAVVALQLLIADGRLDAQDVEGIVLGSDDVASLDVAKLGVGKTEALGDLPKELFLLRVQCLVGLGNVEEAFKHVLEQLTVALERRGELLGVGLVAGYILLGEIEDGGGVTLSVWWPCRG